MGKKQHQKDKLYISASEWKHEWGGKKQTTERKAFRALPFDRCALSLQPFETPVCTPDGIVFDLVDLGLAFSNIIPYLKKHGNKNPVNGKPLHPKDLIRLHFHKNTNGEYHCPVTFKVFNENSHIVAIRTTGNVFSWEAIETLNIKPKSWQELLTGEPFTRADIITIQDPLHLDARNIEAFQHVQEAAKRAADAEQAEAKSTPALINAGNEAVVRALKKVPTTAAAVESGVALAPPAGQAAKRKPEEPPVESKEPKKRKTVYSVGLASTSFTSTTITPVTKNERAEMNDEELREAHYAYIRRRMAGKKAFVRLVTNLGNINLTLHVDLVPRTCHNFLLLCQRKYYNSTLFHRLVPGFMIQGGDPTGTGRGGESAWKKPFQDEFHPVLTHSGRGILSMANSGKNTNTSQFFITFKECKHLDNKHSVFGHVVGGNEVLDAMEATPVEGERPLREIRILDTIVYVNPFDEPWMTEEEEEEARREEERKQEQLDEVRGRWYSTGGADDLKAYSSGIGKYIAPSAIPAGAPAEKPKKKKKKEGEGAAASSSSGSSSSALREMFRAHKAATAGTGASSSSSSSSSYGDFSKW